MRANLPRRSETRQLIWYRELPKGMSGGYRQMAPDNLGPPIAVNFRVIATEPQYLPRGNGGYLASGVQAFEARLDQGENGTNVD